MMTYSLTVAAAEPIAGLKGTTALVLIAVVVVAVSALAVVPLIMDVRRATAWRQQITDRLIDDAATDHDVRDFLRDLREPRGVRGLTRSIIAVLILALIGFALAVAMLSSGADSGDLRKTIVTSLMTVLATVAGFYFGSLGAQNSAEDARRSAGSRVAVSARQGGKQGPAGAGGSRGTGGPGGPDGSPGSFGSAESDESGGSGGGGVELAVAVEPAGDHSAVAAAAAAGPPDPARGAAPAPVPPSGPDA